MTAAYRLRGLGWMASCAGIVLACYLVSLQVASERNKLDALNGRIRVAERDIRALETEFDTRANLQQLERWNGDILALSAPVAGQFMVDHAQLASVSFARPLMGVGADGVEIRTAALVVPSMPAALEPPVLAVAAAPSVVVAPRAAPAVVTASVTPATIVRVSAPTVRPAAPRPLAKPQRVAMLDAGLLSDTTFGDILSGARAESRRR